MNRNYDLIVTRQNGDSFGYVLETPKASMTSSSYDSKSSLVHSKEAPNIPMNIGVSTPAQAGGQYDVRDTDGDKAITHIDWHLGAGQESLDSEDASSARYESSINLEIGAKGKLQLAQKLDFLPVQNIAGPVFSALGYFWVACEGGGVKYSTDGEDWTTAVMNDDTYGPIYDFATDGTSVYFCVPGGSYTGVWQSDNTVPVEFNRLNTSAICALEYSSGMLFGATATGAGHMDPSTHVYTEDTMTFLNVNTTIGLDAVNNKVYWTTSQGGQTYIYDLLYDADTDTVVTTEVTHLRSGFIGTCAKGYLDSLYIAGYLAETNPDIGQGLIYTLTSGSTVPLCRIGPEPMLHPEMRDWELDQRIWALTAAGDKLYIQCSRGLYKWDIDDGGYHHFANFFTPTIGEPTGGDTVYDAFEGGAFQNSAFQSTGVTYESVVHPGICVNAGKVLAPYLVESSQRDLTFTNTVAEPSVIVISEEHGATAGQVVEISGSTASPSCDGLWYITEVLSTSSFTMENAATGLAYDCTIAGAGSISFNCLRGVGVTSDLNAMYGELTTSVTNFHTGSQEKDFWAITVAHDELAETEEITVAYKLDDSDWTYSELLASTGTRSRFDISTGGYSVKIRVTLLSEDGLTSPVINAINVLWNFVPVVRHVYELDCRIGAAAGMWAEDPEAAIRHLYQAANEHCFMEDRFSGEYTGIIEKLAYQQATFSIKEGVSGLVHVQAREV